MASLANQTISSTYDGLIKTSTDQPVGISGVQLLEDGVGNSLALSVGRANQGVTITGTLTATSISGVLADGVTATTQSLGDNSTKVATTAYVDAQVTASDLDFAGDSGTGAVDLDSQSLTIAGTANEIETSASGQTITIGLPNNVSIAGNLTVDTNTLFVDASNNRVGIGTTSPDTALDVIGSSIKLQVIGQTGATLSLNQGNNTTGLADVNYANIKSIVTSGTTSFESGALTFETRNSGTTAERMRINSSGNVGIGAVSNASRLLISKDNTTGNALEISNSGSSRSLDINHNADGTGTVDDIVRISNNGSRKFTIDSSGNVGIGTSSPSQSLHVYHPTLNAISVFESGDANVSITIKDSLASNVILNQGGNFIFQADELNEQADSYFAFDVDGSERMRIDASGRLLVNTTTDPTVTNNGGASITPANNNRAILRLATTGSGDLNLLDFINSNGIVGNIRTNGTSIGIGFEGGAAANTLDDYEEGTWTPTSDTGTVINTINEATYTKIGNVVFVQAWIVLDITASNYRIAGLPFTSSVRETASVVNTTLNEVHSAATIGARIFGYNATIVNNDNMYISATYRV